MCILFVRGVYTLLKVVSHYDLSVLSMSVMDFPKIVWLEGRGELCSFFVKKINFARHLINRQGMCLGRAKQT